MTTIRLYGTYSFKDKDPVIDELRTAKKDSGMTDGKISLDSGVSTACLAGWFRGKTRRPQFATVAAVAGAMGMRFKLVPKHARKKEERVMTDRPEAKVILDSVSPEGHRMQTFQIKAHRFVLAEINTHRKVSKNFRSSRAVPTKKLIEEVRTNPAMPVFWGKNQPGMQAAEELEGNELWCAKDEWRRAASSAASFAEGLGAFNLHKQIVNRVLEPFLWVHGVLSATEFMNMFGLRLHKDAQPEFQVLAEAMWEARKNSVPVELKPGDWHLPYVGQVYQTIHGLRVNEGGMSYAPKQTLTNLIKMSVARCARVSVKPFDSDHPSTAEQDIAFYREKLHLPDAYTEAGPLEDPIHASPAEHQATPDQRRSRDIQWMTPQHHGNLDGWRQYRKLLPGEAIAPLPKGYEIPAG